MQPESERMCSETTESNVVCEITDNFDCSLIIPVYKNEENIEDLLQAINLLQSKVVGGFEVVFVVDGSPDRSYLLLAQALPTCLFTSQLLALSRNFGSF